MKYFYYIIIIFIVLSCKKEKIINEPINNNENCIIIPPSQSLFGYNYAIDSVVYKTPCFNPNNSNEIIFYFESYSDNITSKLVKYNLQTYEKNVLLEAKLYSKPVWAKNNWIVFSLNDENIWRIKSNGDSLTQLTFTGDRFYPEWNNNADRIICGSSNQQCSFILDFNGNIIDTIIGIERHYDWNIDNNILISEDTGIYKYNYNTKELKLYNNEYYPVHFGKAQWINNNEFIASGYYGMYDDNYTGGIYLTNIITNKTIRIKNICNNNIYSSPDYSPQINKLIWQKIKKRKIGENLIEVKFVIVLMNIDCSNEQEIEIK